MSKWTASWDLSTIPDELLTAERNRRIVATRSRSVFVGRPPKLMPCPWCGEKLGVAAMRAHRPACSKNPKSKKGGGTK